MVLKPGDTEPKSVDTGHPPWLPDACWAKGMRRAICTFARGNLSQAWFCGLLANNNDYDDVYGAIIMTSDCEISPGSFDECRLSAG